MPVPTVARGDLPAQVLTQVPYRETFRPVNESATTEGGGGSARPTDGVVIPRPR